MRYLKYLSALLIIALMLFQVTAVAYEGNGGSTSYTYDENGKDGRNCVLFTSDAAEGKGGGGIWWRA